MFCPPPPLLSCHQPATGFYFRGMTVCSRRQSLPPLGHMLLLIFDQSAAFPLSFISPHLPFSSKSRSIGRRKTRREGEKEKWPPSVAKDEGKVIHRPWDLLLLGHSTSRLLLLPLKQLALGCLFLLLFALNK